MAETTKNRSDEKILTSEALKAKNKKFLHAVSGDYNLDLDLKTDKNRIEKNKVFINPRDKAFEESDLVEKTIGMRAAIAQQAFHKKYTDFSAFDDLEKKHGTYSESYKIGKDYLTILEEPAAELAGTYDFPGLKSYVDFRNKKAYDKTPTLSEMEAAGDKLKAHQMASWQYANMGKTKGEFSDPELREMFEKTKKLIDQAKVGKTTKDRLEAAEKIMETVDSLVQQAEQQNDYEPMENPKGNELNEKSEGEGEETPEEAIQQEKEKQEKGESGEPSDQEGEPGEGEGEESDQNSDDNNQGQGQGNGEGEESDQESDGETSSETQQSADAQSNDKDGQEQKGEGKPSKSDQGQKQEGGEQKEQGEASDGDSEGTEFEKSDESSISEKEMERIRKEIEKEMEEIEQEMDEQEESNSDASDELEKTEKELKGVKYGGMHSGINIKAIHNFSKQKEKYNRISERNRPYHRSMARRLQNLLKYNEDEKRTGQDSGFLTQSQLWRKDGRIFSVKKDKNDEAELVMAVLVDESGSMGSCERDKYARSAAIVLAEVCEKLGIPLGILGHTASFGGPTVEMRHFVSFEKPISDQKDNLAHIQAREDNRDGMAIRYTGEYLMKQPQKDKLLIVIADGLPAHGYSGYYGKSAEKDVISVIEDLEKRGVTVVGVAIGDGQDEIENMFRNFISIPNLEKLPQKLVKILEKRLFKN